MIRRPTRPRCPRSTAAGCCTFRVVARERGFSRAARQLGRTQSSVSQAVALLERELGAPLFERRGRTRGC